MDFRAQRLLAELDSCAPIDEREAISILKTRELLLGSDDVFNRDKTLKHITGSAFIFSRQGLAMHLHKRIKTWMQPGGHVDKNEEPIEAARREAKEETGLDVELIGPVFHVDVHSTPSGHEHYDFRYIGVSDELVFKPEPGESTQVQWFSYQQCLAIDDPALCGAIKKLKVEGKFLGT